MIREGQNSSREEFSSKGRGSSYIVLNSGLDFKEIVALYWRWKIVRSGTLLQSDVCPRIAHKTQVAGLIDMENQGPEQVDRKITSEILNFVLSDYTKHGDLDQVLVDRSDNYLERFLTVTTGTVGVILALSELTKPQGISWYIASAILGIPLIIGAASFSRILTIDFYLRGNHVHRENIMKSLLLDYPEIQRYFPVYNTLLDADYKEWSSVTSIIKRAVTYGGPKTIITVGNSIILAVESLLIGIYALHIAVWPTGIILALATLAVTALLHIVYAWVRYKMSRRIFRS